MSKKFKIGILGLMRGRVPLACQKALSDYYEVTAVCEKNPEVIEELKKIGWWNENAKICETYEELLESGIDAVFIAGFFPDHAKNAIKAMEAGVAVLSETTAAPSLGECVDLVEAYERTGTKYMLASNCVFSKPVQKIKEIVASNKFGAPVFGDTEYVHRAKTRDFYKERDPKNTHWRDTLPTCYYNMHDLGSMLYITNGIPRKVVGKALLNPNGPVGGGIKTSNKSYGLVQLDNGVVINYSGSTAFGSMGKWWRVACEYGSVESERFSSEADSTILTCGLNHDNENPEECKQVIDLTWSNCGALTEEESEKIFGDNDFSELHGGIDAVLMYYFIKFLNDEYEPFFDVYNSVTLSATGILAWYSALSGSIELEIPDFRDKASRDKVRNDYRTPFAKNADDVAIPFKLEDKDKFKM